MKRSEFTVRTKWGELPCALAEPDDRPLADAPAILVNLAVDRESMMTHEVYGIPGRVFLETGHRFLAFDIPAHGERTRPHGEGLQGFLAALLAGDDPFELLIDDARAVFDAIAARGLARPDRIFLAGHSRGGYCALRIMAAEPRVAGTVAYATVTDWRALREMAAVKDRPQIAALSLEHFVGPLAGRPIHLVIGNADDRVGTDRVAAFVAGLLAEEARRGMKSSRLSFHVDAGEPGHGLNIDLYRPGAEFLLRVMERTSA